EFVAMVDSRFPGLIAKLEGNNSEYIDSWGKDNYSRVLERLVDEFFNRYADEEKIARRARLFASPLEIKTLAKNAHIGNHSVSHSNMRNISLSDFKEEVKGCEFAIREIIGKKSRYFAFPFGQFNHHWNFAGVSILKEMGFESIFSVENPGYSAKGKPWGDVIPRFEVPCNITTTTGLKDFIRSCNG
ncbi:polysaccharide deacetylase family protein, partial [bacterium]